MNRTERSRNVATAIEREMAKLFRASAAQVTKALDQCRSSLLSQAENELDRREICRRIAEAKISVLYSRKGADREFEDAWEELIGLGFSSAEREAAMTFYYVKFMKMKGGESSRLSIALERYQELVKIIADAGEGELASHLSRAIEI